MSFAKKIENAIERVGAYREAVGNDVDLCVEIHRQLNIPEAIAFAHGIEEFHPFFLEDPTTPDNFDSMIGIASRVNIPVATGERYHTPQEFAMLMKHDGAQYVRPDICLCGGITGGKRLLLWQKQMESWWFRITHLVQFLRLLVFKLRQLLLILRCRSTRVTTDRPQRIIFQQL